MNVLIVAATEFEIGPWLNWNKSHIPRADSLVTGVGMTATAFTLTKYLQNWKYDLIIQAGVGGSYTEDLGLGDVVFVRSDQFGDAGAEDHDKYLDLYEMGLLSENQFPFSAKKLINPLEVVSNQIVLPQVSGLTVNTVSGSERTIKLRKEKYGCQVESMEGAAFHYVCLQEKVAFAQIRAISNYVTPRDKSRWKMKDAIVNLNEWLINFIESLRFVNF